MKMKDLLNQAKALLEDQPNNIALLSNASAFIFDSIYNLNWAGFYLYDQNKLTLGPFQGHVACSVIQMNQGVCGEAAYQRKTRVVDDVLSYDNHIACDSNSRSEIVVPIIINHQLYGVLDVDAPVKNRFNQELIDFFESFVKILELMIDI